MYFIPRGDISGVDETHKGNAAMAFQSGGEINSMKSRRARDDFNLACLINQILHSAPEPSYA